MSELAIPQPQRRASLAQCLAIQARVIGAVIMRELHTRYGRDNIGYLWLIGEPLMLGSIISALHSASGHGGGINPVAFTVAGYCNFIMFRGIVNRSEGSIHANAPLLYHRMVTVFDVTFGRALLEAAGSISAFTILMGICMGLGYVDLPARPAYLLMGIGYLFWISLGISMMIVGGTHERAFLERMVHPFTYFMIPLSGAFYMLEWVSPNYRQYVLYSPLPHVFEIIRYGMFLEARQDYFDISYLTEFCAITMLFGLLLMRSVKSRIHLS